MVAVSFVVKMKLEIECGTVFRGDCWARNVEIVCILTFRTNWEMNPFQDDLQVSESAR